MGNENDTASNANENQSAALPTRAEKWISSGAGGLVGAIGTILVIVIPVINTWLANTHEIQLQQIKNSTEQIEYITKRMRDSDKERDLYRSEMNSCNVELRACQIALSKAGK